MDKFKNIPRHLLFGGCLAILVVIFIGYGLFQNKTSEEKTLEKQLFTKETEESSVEAIIEPAIIFVDIKGSIQHPGLYQVEADDRLYDVIQQAGGLKEEADEQQVNFAAKVVDQQMIYIPKVGEEIPLKYSETVVVPSTETAVEEDKINLNTADVDELKNLSGIGEKRARDIISYREEHGSFQKIEELQEVAGIGEKTVENLKSSVTIK